MLLQKESFDPLYIIYKIINFAILHIICDTVNESSACLLLACTLDLCNLCTAVGYLMSLARDVVLMAAFRYGDHEGWQCKQKQKIESKQTSLNESEVGLQYKQFKLTI